MQLRKAPNARINRAGINIETIQASRMKATLLPLRLNELLGAVLKKRSAPGLVF
jgi:hypothetical protein